MRTESHLPPQALVDCIRRTEGFVLVPHVKPDADALGSTLGLHFVLSALGKKTLLLTEEPVSSLYRFFPGSGLAVCDTALVADFISGQESAAIILDCGDRLRLGKTLAALETIEPLIVIDHHLGHQEFGSMRWVEPERSSTGEMVHDLALSLAPSMPPEAAFCLFTAIAADTGSFRYDCARAHTFRVAADLLDQGVCLQEVAGHLFDNYSFARLQLLQRVLASLELHAGGRIAVISLTEKMLAETGAQLDDTEGFVNYPRALKDVEVALMLKEGRDVISVSMRAKGTCNVAAVAATYGGGGHRNAAGFRCPGASIASVRDDVLLRLQAALMPVCACPNSDGLV